MVEISGPCPKSSRIISLLVTTTILERGVTISNVAVAVLGAENPVFDEAALVQISGRVGRDRKFPEGEICFLLASSRWELVM